MRCMMLSIRRLVCKSERTLPVTIIGTSPGFTWSPSFINVSTCISGSKRWNTSRAMRRPARMPSSLISNFDLPIASSGMQQRVVWSPSPMSSEKARSIRRSLSSSTVYIYIILSVICRKITHKKRVRTACKGKNRLFLADNAFFTLIRALWHCFCCYFIIEKSNDLVNK